MTKWDFQCVQFVNNNKESVSRKCFLVTILKKKTSLCHSFVIFFKVDERKLVKLVVVLSLRSPFKGSNQQVSVWGQSAGRTLSASSCCRRNILERLASEPLVPGCCSLRVLMINWECYCPLGPSCPSSAVDPLRCLWATKLAPFMC